MNANYEFSKTRRKCFCLYDYLTFFLLTQHISAHFLRFSRIPSSGSNKTIVLMTRRVAKTLCRHLRDHDKVGIRQQRI